MSGVIHAENASTAESDPVKSTGNRLHVTPAEAASADVNAGLVADGDALVAAATGLRLMGFSARESDGIPAVASFDIVHGATGAAGTDLFYVELAANESKSEWFGPDGLDAASGISTDHVAGTYDLVIHYKTIA